MKKQAKQIIELANKFFWPIVAGAMVASFGLAMWASQGQSVWFDEGYSIILAQRPWHELFALTAVDAHPPLYYVLLKLWASMFGWSEFSLRSMSAVFGALGVGASLLLVRTVFTKRIALAVLPFVTIAPFLVRYNYEIRMYALVSFIGILATWLLVKAYQTDDKKWWGAYAVSVTLGMLTLYLSVAIWLTHALWLLVTTLRNKKNLLRQKWVYAYIAAVVLFLPYLPTTINQFMHSVLPGVGSQVTFETLASIVGMLISYTPAWQINGWLTIGLLLLIILVVQLGRSVWQSADKHRRLMLGLFAGLVIVPITFFTLTSLPPRDPIFIIRYEAHVAVFIYLWVGLVVALGWHYGKRRLSAATGIFAGVLLICGVGTLLHTGNLNLERLQLPKGHEVRREVTCNDTTTIVADDPYTYIDSFYYFDGCDLRFYSKDELGPRGGYAPLKGQPSRLADTNIDTKTVVHLRWDGNVPAFILDPAKYKLQSSQTFEKQVVDIYVRQ